MEQYAGSVEKQLLSYSPRSYGFQAGLGGDPRLLHVYRNCMHVTHCERKSLLEHRYATLQLHVMLEWPLFFAYKGGPEQIYFCPTKGLAKGMGRECQRKVGWQRDQI